MAENKQEVASLRREYKDAELQDNQLPDEPFVLFRQWFYEAVASDVLEPNAMTLATVESNGWPNARTVLMKGIGESSVRFFTNYESQKAKEIMHNARAACVFWGGYDIEVDHIEFWQGRPGRLHDRILYEYREQGWTRKRLMP